MEATTLSLHDAAAVIDELFTPARLRDPVRPLLALEEGPHAFEMYARMPQIRAEEIHIVAGEDYLEFEAAHREAPRLRCCLVGRGRELTIARRYRLASPIVPGRVDARLIEGEFWLRLPKLSDPRGAPQAPVRVQVSG